jgi:hypothetical protein
MACCIYLGASEYLLVPSSMSVTNSGVSSRSLKKPASSEDIGENDRQDSCIVVRKRTLLTPSALNIIIITDGQYVCSSLVRNLGVMTTFRDHASFSSSPNLHSLQKKGNKKQQQLIQRSSSVKEGRLHHDARDTVRI